MHISLLLALSFLLSPLNWLLYTDPADRFSVKYPDTWELKVENDVVSLLAAVESDADQFRENVNAMVQDLSQQPMTMTEYTKLTTDWVKESNGVMQLEREIEFAGHPATEVAYTLPANATGMDLEVMFHQVWLLKDNKAYLLTYAAEPHSYEKFELEAAEIFKSFVLKAK